MSEAASLLRGAAAIEPGCAPEEALARLAAHNPEARARSEAGAALLAERAQRLQQLLHDRFGVEPDAANGGPLVPAERHYELAHALLHELGYTQYVTACASHWPAQKDQPEQLEIATVLRIPGAGSHTASWRVRVPVPGEVDSLVSLFAGADWQEREQYDLLGVRFRGHPDLRRIMLPDEWEGHPLRKDYAIDTRCEPWR